MVANPGTEFHANKFKVDAQTSTQIAWLTPNIDIINLYHFPYNIPGTFGEQLCVHA